MMSHKKTVGIVQNVTRGEQRKRVADGMCNGISVMHVGISFNPYDAPSDGNAV